VPSDTLPCTNAGTATRQGRTHEQNQDRAALFDARLPRVLRQRRGSIFVLCDGVSSVRDGTWAAEWSSQRIGSFFDEDVPATPEGLMGLIHELDWELRGKGHGQAACTLSLLWLASGRAHVIQIGDSEVFWVRDGQMNPIRPRKTRGRRLDAWLGMGPAVEKAARLWSQDLLVGDLFLLVTDGVTARVDAEFMWDQWWAMAGNPTSTAEAIVAEADRRLTPDDATAVVVDLLALESPSSLFPR
jgi:serine/threonine protein phosphatase PrpC